MSPHQIRFSHGGHAFAAVSGSTIVVASDAFNCAGSDGDGGGSNGGAALSGFVTLRGHSAPVTVGGSRVACTGQGYRRPMPAKL
jgi:hypothetical protein